MAATVLFLSFAATNVAEGSQRGVKFGGSLGFGGSGIQQAVQVNGATSVVERSEGPGTIYLFAERLMSDYFSLGLEHSRGFSFGPFSTGSSFTGFAGRYYYLGPAPSVGAVSATETVLVVRRFTPFAGLATGIAEAEIKRDNDLVRSVSGSGIYIGLRTGADYPLAAGIGIRPEMTYSTTFFQSPTLPSTLSEFSLQCGIYMAL